jgi:hypothetical protein
MLAQQPQNLLNLLARSNPIAYGFAKTRRATTAAGFIVYCGIISVTAALWMWLWRNTAFQPRTITTIAALVLICSSVYLYPRLRRGFGTFCMILLTSGIGLAICSRAQAQFSENSPQIPAIALIFVGLSIYLIQTRFITGTMLLLTVCGAGIGFFWFHPAFFNPFILFNAGFILVFAGCILRSIVFFNNYY